MNKWALLSFVAILLLSSLLTGPSAFASSLKEMQQEKNQLEQKKNALHSDIKKKEAQMDTNKSTITQIMDQIQTLNKQVSETNEKMNRVEAEIAKTTEEIKELKISIVDLENKIEERDLVLRERARAMQANGGSVSYLDVLLGANSFSDFIDRFSAVSTIMDADRKIMQQQAADIEQLEEEKKLVEHKLAKQEKNKKKLKELKASLESQKKEKDGLIDKLEAEQEKLSSEKSSLEEAYEETHEMSKELEQEIVAEQKRAAEAARKAEEQRRQASVSQSSGSSNPSYTAPAVSDGTWTRPASGRLTSPFGWRTHPTLGVQRQHRGMDIANSVGTPIVAAGDGVVTRAGWNGSYGNMVMITHMVGGQVYTTVYAHLSSVGVSSGQQVSKGQFIGKMGATGRVTGPHLHFELHVGYYSGSGPSAVNPLRYVPF